MSFPPNGTECKRKCLWGVGWEEEGIAGSLLDSSEGSFPHMDIGALCWYLLSVATVIWCETLCWAL